MKWEELKTPDAVMAAFEAGRHVEVKPRFVDRWFGGVAELATADGVASAISEGVRYRALIEDAPLIPEGFTAWAGGECPEDAKDQTTTVVMRDGTLCSRGRGDWYDWRYDWRNSGSPGDIIAYRVEQPERQGEADALTHFVDGLGWVVPCSRAAEYVRELGNARNSLLTPVESLGRDADPLRDVVEMIATRARNFPNFPMGYYMGELFRAIGQEPPTRDAGDGVEALSASIHQILEAKFTLCDEPLPGDCADVLRDAARRLRPTVDEAMVERVAYALMHADGNAYAYEHYETLACAALTAALTTRDQS